MNDFRLVSALLETTFREYRNRNVNLLTQKGYHKNFNDALNGERHLH